MMGTTTGVGVNVTVGAAVGALAGVWAGVMAAVEVGEASGTGKDAVGDGCRAEGRPHPTMVAARIAMHNRCLILIVHLLNLALILTQERGNDPPNAPRYLAQSTPSTSHDAPMQSPGSSSISCR